MKKRKNAKIMLGLLIAVIGLGVGYAMISGVNLLVNGSAGLNANGNFNVKFVRPESNENAITISGHNADDSAMNVSEMSASIIDDTHATFAVGALDEIGEYVDFTYTVINESDEGIDALLSFDVADENELSNYFEITKSVTKNRITTNETTTVTVRVKLIGQPKVNDANATFKLTLTATPVDEIVEKEKIVYSTLGGADIGTIITPANYQSTNENINGPYMKYTVDSENQVVKVESCKTATANANAICLIASDASEYSNNKALLASYFGGSIDNIPSQCSEENNYGEMEFTCANSYVVIATDNGGGVWIMDKENGRQCVINNILGQRSCKQN